MIEIHRIYIVDIATFIVSLSCPTINYDIVLKNIMNIIFKFPFVLHKHLQEVN